MRSTTSVAALLAVLASPVWGRIMCGVKVNKRYFQTASLTGSGDERYNFNAFEAECFDVYDGGKKKPWNLYVKSCNLGDFDAEQGACTGCHMLTRADFPAGTLDEGDQFRDGQSCGDQGSSPYCSCHKTVKKKHCDDRGNCDEWTEGKEFAVKKKVLCKDGEMVEHEGRSFPCMNMNQHLHQGETAKAMTPQIRCPGLKFSEMTSMPKVQIMSPTAENQIFNTLRQMFYYGIEDPWAVMRNTTKAGNKLVAIMFESICKQGNCLKVGPSIEELTSKCQVRPNIFLSPEGNALAGNKFINITKNMIRSPPCNADRILQVKKEMGGLYGKLTQISESTIRCGQQSSDGDGSKKRRLSDNKAWTAFEVEEMWQKQGLVLEGHDDNAFTRAARWKSANARAASMNRRLQKLPKFFVPKALGKTLNLRFDAPKVFGKAWRRLDVPTGFGEALRRPAFSSFRRLEMQKFRNATVDTNKDGKVQSAEFLAWAKKVFPPAEFESESPAAVAKMKEMCGGDSCDPETFAKFIKSLSGDSSDDVSKTTQYVSTDQEDTGKGGGQGPTLKELDTNEDGKVQSAEFLAWAKKVSPADEFESQSGPAVAKMKEMCGGDSCDPDTFAKFWNSLTGDREVLLSGQDNGKGGGQMPNFDEIDTNGDDNIQLDEYVAWQKTQHSAADFEAGKDQTMGAFVKACGGNSCSKMLWERWISSMEGGGDKGSGGAGGPAKFEDYDTNGDGQVQLEEYVAWAKREVSAADFENGKDRAIAEFKRVCGGDTCSKDKFALIMTNDGGSDLDMTFNGMNKDGNGWVSPDELRTFLRDQDGTEIDNSTMTTLMAFDKDGSGGWNKEELGTMITAMTQDDGGGRQEEQHYDATKEWEMKDGMDCGHKRRIVERTLETSMNRAFAYAAKDSWTGCYGLLDSWTVSGTATSTYRTSQCVVPDRLENTNMNPAWLKDPCCNHDKQGQQCCASRNVTVSAETIVGINNDKIAEYAAETGTNNLALTVAQGYAKLERNAAATCFQPFIAAWNGFKDTFKILDTCFDSLEGTYSETFQKRLGKECTMDSECYTELCEAPKAIANGAAAASSGQATKYCVTPEDMPDKDYATAAIRCLLDPKTTPGDVISNFVWSALGTSTTDAKVIAKKMLAKSGMLRHECRGRGANSWQKKTEEECMKATACNWDQSLGDEKCLNPCLEGHKCPEYCTQPGGMSSWDVGRLPTCQAQNMNWDTISGCWNNASEYEQQASSKCDECRQSCQGKEQTCYEGCAKLPGWGCDGEKLQREQWTMIQACQDKGCSTYKDNNGNSAKFGQDTCMWPTLSYTTDKQEQCDGECKEKGGPNPAAPKRCFANVQRNMSKVDQVCQNLGEGRIETRHMQIDNWDWGKLGRPPAEHCLITEYQAVDGKPYVQPPPFGPECTEQCASQFYECIEPPMCHEDDRYGKCYKIFAQYSMKFENCTNPRTPSGDHIGYQCQGQNCWQEAQDKCGAAIGLLKDKDFLETKCKECSGPWRNWDKTQMKCFKSLPNSPVACAWDDSRQNQICARDCEYSDCHRRLESCMLGGKSRGACATEVTKLNQCRWCELVHCDKTRCAKSCDSGEFHSSQDSDSSCAGCDATSQCNPAATCYNNRTCFPNERPDRGEACPRACENAISACEHKDMEHCHKRTKVTGQGESSFQEQCGRPFHQNESVRQTVEQCKNWFRGNNTMPAYQTYNKSMEQKMAEACYTYPGMDAKCQTCNGQWNRHNLWLTSRASQCLTTGFEFKSWDESTMQMPESCATKCVAKTCSNYPIACHEMVWSLTKCRGVRMQLTEGVKGDHKEGDKYQHYEFCENSKGQASAMTVKNNKACVGCEKQAGSNCDSMCKNPCNQLKEDHEKTVSDNLRDSWPRERCQGCPAGSKYQCFPGADCYMSNVRPNKGSFALQNRTNDQMYALAKEYRDMSLKCKFPQHKHRRLATEGKSVDVKQSAQENLQKLTENAQRLSTEMSQHQDQERSLKARISSLAGSKSTEQREHLERKLKEVMDKKTAINSAMPRRLRRPEPKSVSLVCTSGTCEKEKALCDAFFVRTGADKALVDATVSSHQFAGAPWDNELKICNELGKTCYVGIAEVKKDIEAAGWSVPTWCDQYSINNCDLKEECWGCHNGTKDGCTHCCQCQNTTVHATMGLDARITQGGNDAVCQVIREDSVKAFKKKYNIPECPNDAHQRGIDCWEMGSGYNAWEHEKYNEEVASYHYDDRLMGGTGACRHHVPWRQNMPFVPNKCKGDAGVACHKDPNCAKDCPTGLCANPKRDRYFEKTRRWEAGQLSTKTTCEAEACSPNPWMRTKDECLKHSSHCQGDCASCVTKDYWDWDKKQAAMRCQFVDASDKKTPLSKEDCLKACGTFSDTCKFIADSGSGFKACITGPLADAVGENMEQKCSGQRKDLVGGSVSQAMYQIFECEHVPIDTCMSKSWLKKQLPSEMNCQVGRSGCKDKQACKESGRCDIQGDDYQAQKQGGLCIRPHNFSYMNDPKYTPYDHRGWDSYCPKVAGFRMETRSWGCFVWKDRNSKPDGSVGGTPGGGTPGGGNPAPTEAPAPGGGSDKLQEQIMAMLSFSNVDSNSDKTIVFAEYQAAMKNYNNLTMQKGSDGVEGSRGHYVTQSKEFMEMCGQGCDAAKWGEAIKAKLGGEDPLPKFGDIDTNSDGKVMLDEFVAWAKKVTSAEDFKKHKDSEIAKFKEGCGIKDEAKDGCDQATLEKMMKDDGRRLQSTMDDEGGQGNMLDSASCLALPGAIWRPYAWKQSSCEVPGHVFSKDSKGTMACCRKYRKGGGKYECFEWSKNDDTKEKCEACAGKAKWMSIFTWQAYGTWIQGTWKKAYTWKKRSLDKQNYWITQLDRGRMYQLWENAVMGVRATPMSNFLKCRINPTLDTLTAIATAKLPTPSLATTKVLPGQATSQEVGAGVSVATDKDTNTGSIPISLDINLDSVANQLSTEGESGGNLTRRLWTKNDRRLADDSLSVDSLAASCYAVVKVETKAVGQLVGDCVEFTPTAALTGTAELCFSINSQISVNPALTVWGVAVKSKGAYTTQAGTPVMSGESLCAKVKATGIYCPIKYSAAYTPGQALPSGFQGADASCGQMAAAKSKISAQVTKLKVSGFTGSGNLVQVGQVTAPPSEAVVDTQGGLLSSSGAVENVQSFVDTATKAPTFTTTTTKPKPKPKSLFGSSDSTTGTTGGSKADDSTTGGSTTGQATTGNTDKDGTTGGGTTGGGGSTTGSSAPPTISYGGQLSLKFLFLGVTNSQVATATTAVLAEQFAVEKSAVTVTATESRRLSEATPRQLAGNWKVDFTVTAAASKLAAIESKVTALKSSTASLKTGMTSELKKAGADQKALDSLSVSSFSATKNQSSGAKVQLETANFGTRPLVSMWLAGFVALVALR